MACCPETRNTTRGQSLPAVATELSELWTMTTSSSKWSKSWNSTLLMQVSNLTKQRPLSSTKCVVLSPAQFSRLNYFPTKFTSQDGVCLIFHPSILCRLSWSLSQLSYGERQGAAWTGHQSVARLTQCFIFLLSYLWIPITGRMEKSGMQCHIDCNSETCGL